MKATGIVRRVDDLGRIVIPKEIRDKLSIDDGAPMELYIFSDAVLFRKYIPDETMGVDPFGVHYEEFGYLINFIAGEKAIDSIEGMGQIRSLWTAYCLHQNLEVDTAEYDNRMMEMWSVMRGNEKIPYSSNEYERFYNDMSRCLV